MIQLTQVSKTYGGAAQAHHALEQRAMDARISLRDAALAVLNTYVEA